MRPVTIEDGRVVTHEPERPVPLGSTHYDGCWRSTDPTHANCAYNAMLALSAQLATVEAERDRLRQLGGDHLITALAFLAAHHDQQRARAADAILSRFTDEEVANCERHVAHHTEQLYQIGELIALLGGRNAYPRPAATRPPTPGDTP